MRWKIKKKQQKIIFVKPIGFKPPEIGDIKNITKFAYLPVEINKTEKVWLEKYIEIHEYKKVVYRKPITEICSDNRFNGDYLNETFQPLGEKNEWVLKERTFL